MKGNIAEEKYLSDGIYEVSKDTEVLQLHDGFADTGEFNSVESVWTKANPDFVIAAPYQVFLTFALSKRPKRFSGGEISNGFNHGTCALLEDCPKRLLILGEDD